MSCQACQDQASADPQLYDAIAPREGLDSHHATIHLPAFCKSTNPVKSREYLEAATNISVAREIAGQFVWLGGFRDSYLFVYIQRLCLCAKGR
jgi:hypothetical protein